MRSQNIQLQFFDDDFEEQLNAYQLTEEQLKHTASPKRALERSKTDATHIPVLMVDHKKNLIGFFILNKNQTTYSEIKNESAILLRSFSVDNRYQRNGFGKKAMLMIPSFIKNNFPEINEIVLGVNENNSIAKNLYLSIGYKPTGIRFLGRSGWQDILRLYLL